MNCYAYQQNNVAEEMRISEELESLVCPKPRRIGGGGWSHSVVADHIRPNNNRNRQMGISGHNVGVGLLDIILAEGSSGNDKSAGQVVSSPPYFFGSPPTRSLNPVTQDDRFGNQKVLMPLLSSVKSASPVSSPSSCKVGGTRTKMSQKPAAIRIEGFDYLGRDRQNCSIYNVV